MTIQACVERNNIVVVSYRFPLVGVIQKGGVGLLFAGTRRLPLSGEVVVGIVAVSTVPTVLAVATVLVEDVVPGRFLELVEVRRDAPDQFVVPVGSGGAVLQLGEHLLHARRALGDVRRADGLQTGPVEGCRAIMKGC